MKFRFQSLRNGREKSKSNSMYFELFYFTIYLLELLENTTEGDKERLSTSFE